MLVAAVLAKFSYEFTLNLQAGMAAGDAAWDVMKRIVIGPEIRGLAFFYILIVGLGQLTTGLKLPYLKPSTPKD